jgi:endonuclease/exonuclease/phosphatase family metal-dependent hydrolase
MLELIRDMKVDVLGMLETDLHRFVYGNRDLTRAISEELGYYIDLGPGPNKHTWGAALISKFPILNSTHHLLPSPQGELAPAIHATLDIHGEHVNVFVSHNGQHEDALDRELQTTEIARLLREIADKWRWCEYIAFRGLWRVAYARVHESDISDTEMQVSRPSSGCTAC